MIEIDTGVVRLLIVIWLLPAAAMLLLLVATHRAPATRWVRVAVSLAILAYVAGAVVLTQWPFVLDLSVARVIHGNWTPFGGSIGLLLDGHTSDAPGNAAMILPLGLLVPYVSRAWHGIVPAVAFVVLLAFGLEFAQGLTIDRTFDIDDPIAGSLGGVSGALAAWVLRPLAASRARG